MKTKIISFCIAILASTSMFAQSIWFEQDIRVPDKKPAMFYTQIQYTKNIGTTGISIAPYLATSYDWHEGLAFVNYTKGIFSGGIGAGIEADKTIQKIGFRWSPWLRLSPVIHPWEDGTLEILSQWEFGKEKDNYWYSNSIIFKSHSTDNSSGEFGVLCRRFYGVGPIIGVTFNIKKETTFRIALAALRDLENGRDNPTAFVTITL